MLKLRKGFTLIELLIVVVIIGILAAIAIPKFANTKSKAYKTAMISDLRNLVTAEEAFFSDSGKYSTTIDSSHVKFAPSTGVRLPTIATAPATDRHEHARSDGRRLRHRHEHDESDGVDRG
jgi:prepilin-type N-terminal cleavage/methylation domain-containing protein